MQASFPLSFCSPGFDLLMICLFICLYFVSACLNMIDGIEEKGERGGGGGGEDFLISNNIIDNE